jgi:uncharacterized membrane protein YfcA
MIWPDLATLWVPETLLALLVASLAGLARGFTGFGAAMILVPGLSLVMAPTQAVVILFLLGIFNAFQMVPQAIREARWTDMGPMSIAAVLFVPVGTALLIWIDPVLIRRMIGGVVIAAAAIMVSGWSYSGQRTLPSNLAVGGACGLMQGMTGIGGPPVIFYLLSSGNRPVAENRAGFIALFAAMQVSGVPAVWVGGLLNWEALWMTLILLPIYMAATALGAKLFDPSREKLYRQLTLGFLVAMGAAALLR